MLRINYLCGRITNMAHYIRLLLMVVICSELTTFAVESPTITKTIKNENGCDLLRINYLCGRITNTSQVCYRASAVVICSELTTFAVESPTVNKKNNYLTSCDLLRINYLCGRITNSGGIFSPSDDVVICSELTTFAVESPTVSAQKETSDVL